MKIVVTSDIHFGITKQKTVRKLARRLSRMEPDLFVLAGDVGELGGYFLKCLEIMDSVCENRAILAGNHDLWTRRPDIATSRELFYDIWPGVSKELGWVWLEDNVLKFDNIAVVGSIAWYDYSGASNIPKDICRLQKPHYNNDGNYMDKDWDDEKFAKICRTGLLAKCAQLEEDDDIDHVVVITHVPVFEVQHIRKPGDSLEANAYFYHYTLGKSLLKMGKVREVISGHTHRGMNEVIERPKMSPIRVRTVPSEYHKPYFIELDTNEFCDNKSPDGD